MRNLVRKYKTVNLRWNLVPRLTRICRFFCHVHFLPFFTESTIFEQIWSRNIKTVSLRWNLVIRLIRVCWNQWWYFHFLFFGREMLFSDKFGLKKKRRQFKLKLGTRLISVCRIYVINVINYVILHMRYFFLFL